MRSQVIIGWTIVVCYIVNQVDSSCLCKSKSHHHIYQPSILDDLKLGKLCDCNLPNNFQPVDDLCNCKRRIVRPSRPIRWPRPRPCYKKVCLPKINKKAVVDIVDTVFDLIIDVKDRLCKGLRSINNEHDLNLDDHKGDEEIKKCNNAVCNCPEKRTEPTFPVDSLSLSIAYDMARRANLAYKEANIAYGFRSEPQTEEKVKPKNVPEEKLYAIDRPIFELKPVCSKTDGSKCDGDWEDEIDRIHPEHLSYGQVGYCETEPCKNKFLKVERDERHSCDKCHYRNELLQFDS